MTPFYAKWIWGLGVIAWYIMHLPHEWRWYHTIKVRRVDRRREIARLAIITCGLFLIPLVYVATGTPQAADYPFQSRCAYAGAILFITSLAIMWKTHEDLGRNWSMTLEIQEGHKLVTSGIYSKIRHPMYAAFWLWAIAQFLLLPNLVAGASGLVGFGILYFSRVPREERLMVETFGQEYQDYAAKTWRLLPGIY